MDRNAGPACVGAGAAGGPAADRGNAHGAAAFSALAQAALGAGAGASAGPGRRAGAKPLSGADDQPGGHRGHRHHCGGGQRHGAGRAGGAGLDVAERGGGHGYKICRVYAGRPLAHACGPGRADAGAANGGGRPPWPGAGGAVGGLCSLRGLRHRLPDPGQRPGGDRPAPLGTAAALDGAGTSGPQFGGAGGRGQTGGHRVRGAGAGDGAGVSGGGLDRPASGQGAAAGGLWGDSGRGGAARRLAARRPVGHCLRSIQPRGGAGQRRHCGGRRPHRPPGPAGLCGHDGGVSGRHGAVQPDGAGAGGFGGAGPGRYAGGAGRPGLRAAAWPGGNTGGGPEPGAVCPFHAAGVGILRRDGPVLPHRRAGVPGLPAGLVRRGAGGGLPAPAPRLDGGGAVQRAAGGAQFGGPVAAARPGGAAVPGV